MRYLLQLNPYDREGPFAQLTGKLLDANRQPLENLEKPVAVNEIRKGVDVRTVGDAYVEAGGRDRLGDYLWYHVHGNPAFSSDLMQAIDESDVVIDPDVYRWPLHVVRDLRREYTLLWATKRWAVLDLAESEVVFFPGTDVIREVKRWVLDEEETPQYDVFATSYLRWIVSERFRHVVERGRFTGFSFTET